MFPLPQHAPTPFLEVHGIYFQFLLRTKLESTKVYFANIYKDEDNFEILQFASKAEAENAVAENLKFLEASESGAEE
ncbi:hypothetical protein [Acinetobacter baumannii]|uniref:hypothetical protein n=1 Tax=Acinetobacter baumannii TaxID=470 RepID=UPI00346335FA